MNQASTPASLDLIMPVYNEGANIGKALAEIADRVQLDKRVLVVYDFDGDNTLPALRELAPRYPFVTTIKNTLGRGVLNAIRAGIAASTAEVVIVTMADLSDDFSRLEEVLIVMSAPLDDSGQAGREVPGSTATATPRK